MPFTLSITLFDEVGGWCRDREKESSLLDIQCIILKFLLCLKLVLIVGKKGGANVFLGQITCT